MRCRGEETTLTPEEGLRLLGTVPVGRVVFTAKALPAISPVGHVVEDGDIVIRTNLAEAILGHGLGATVVAYQGDAIDVVGRHGWSVAVTGPANLVTDPDKVSRYRELIEPLGCGEADAFIVIHADMVTGEALLEGAP